MSMGRVSKLDTSHQSVIKIERFISWLKESLAQLEADLTKTDPYDASISAAEVLSMAEAICEDAQLYASQEKLRKQKR